MSGRPSHAANAVDILIVGGGPAGSAAAITAAQHGLKVALVEALPFPRPLPGETLHPGVEGVFRQLGVWDRILAAGFHRHPGIEIVKNGAGEFSAYGSDDAGPWLGFQADRARLDGVLLDHARTLGADVRQPDRIRSLSGDGPFEAALGEGDIRADWVIDAAGSTHWLARRRNRPIRYLTGPLLCGWDWRSETGEDEDHPVLRLFEKGWAWRAPIGHGRVALASMIYGRAGRSLKRQRDVTWRRPVEVCGTRWFAVGDAAGVLDPASGKGVLRAMMSGMMAGWLIARVRDGRASAGAAADHYQSWFTSAFDREAEALATLVGVELLQRPMPSSLASHRPRTV